MSYWNRTAVGRKWASGSVAVLLALQPAIAPAQDVATGRVLAERWCANCHIVTRSATTGRADGVPSFPALADAPQTTDTSLRRAMSASHGRMPDFSLTSREQDDLIAYIRTLGKR